MLFKVASKHDKTKHFNVYAVSDFEGFSLVPKFLMYENGKWSWEFAHNYIPVE